VLLQPAPHMGLERPLHAPCPGIVPSHTRREAVECKLYYLLAWSEKVN
jgi:hypothetical protein